MGLGDIFSRTACLYGPPPDDMVAGLYGPAPDAVENTALLYGPPPDDLIEALYGPPPDDEFSGALYGPLPDEFEMYDEPVDLYGPPEYVDDYNDLPAVDEEENYRPNTYKDLWRVWRSMRGE